MYQLRNLIHRSSVPSDPQNNMNSAEDFLLLLLHAYVVAAADMIQQFNPAESVSDLARSIITNFVRLPRVSDTATVEPCTDGVHLYAIELLSLGLLWHGFHDACKEGDGERILRYWKFLLVVFKTTNHRNYAKDAVILLFQYYYKFSERQQHQLLWSRCVNTRGAPGVNIPADLHMEHLNRRLKMVIRGMGANKSSKAFERAGKSIAPVHRVCQSFERQTASRYHSDNHPYPSFGKDFTTVVDQLKSDNVFVPSGRNHNSFKFTCGLMEKLSKEELNKNVTKSIKKLM